MTRFGAVLVTYASTLAIGVSAFIQPTPILIWNASASVPVGLYAVRPPRVLQIGDIVIVRPPELLASYLDARKSLPRGVPLVKPVAALGGQSVCRRGGLVSVDGAPRARAQARDHRNRPLPVWQGCRSLSADEVFLMNAAEPDSLDGRYFGPLPLAAVVGRATPLWLPKAR